MVLLFLHLSLAFTLIYSHTNRLFLDLTVSYVYVLIRLFYAFFESIWTCLHGFRSERFRSGFSFEFLWKAGMIVYVGALTRDFVLVYEFCVVVDSLAFPCLANCF